MTNDRRRPVAIALIKKGSQMLAEGNAKLVLAQRQIASAQKLIDKGAAVLRGSRGKG